MLKFSFDYQAWIVTQSRRTHKFKECNLVGTPLKVLLPKSYSGLRLFDLNFASNAPVIPMPWPV